MDNNDKNIPHSELTYADKFDGDLTNNNQIKNNRHNKNNYEKNINERNLYYNFEDESNIKNKALHHKIILSGLNNNQLTQDKINYYQFNKKIQMQIENEKKDNNQGIKKLGYIKSKSNNSKNYALYNEQSNTKDLNEIINELKDENLNLKTQNQILNVSLIQKEQIIDDLNNQINNLEKKLKSNKSTNIKSNINNSEDNLKEEINKLKMENNELSEQNNKLTLGINSFNERIKEINEIYNKKNEMFINEINSYKNKMVEYKTKIILLKKKIDELYNSNNLNGVNNNVIIEPHMISALNYNKDYEYNNQIEDLLNKNKNLTPNRIDIKEKKLSYRRKRNKKEKIIKYNMDEKENNLKNEQNNFIENYKMFLNNLGV